MASSIMPDVARPVQILPPETYGQSGIYFLWLNGTIVYVGQADDMRCRIGNHLTEATKKFDAVSCCPCPAYHRLRLEKFFITKHLPRYNKCGHVQGVRRLLEAGLSHEALITDTAKGLCLPSEAAAAILGMGVDDLEGLGENGPPFVTGRVPRIRTRYRSYKLVDLIAFTAADERLAA
jgi:hypothetical protein